MPVSILIVDDEPDMAELFRRRFRSELRAGRYVLHFAGSGEAALAAMDTGIEPEVMLILSDINMPGMSGFELLRQAKQRWPALPVAMITAYGDPESERRANAAGAAAFLTKPLDFPALKARIETMLSGRLDLPPGA